MCFFPTRIVSFPSRSFPPRSSFLGCNPQEETPTALFSRIQRWKRNCQRAPPTPPRCFETFHRDGSREGGGRLKTHKSGGGAADRIKGLKFVFSTTAAARGGNPEIVRWKKKKEINGSRSRPVMKAGSWCGPAGSISSKGCCCCALFLVVAFPNFFPLPRVIFRGSPRANFAPMMHS